MSWPALIALGYFAGSAGVVLWLLAGALAARRMVRRARSAPANVNDLLRQTECGRSATAELLVSDELDVAVALGVLHARVLLPRQWVNSRSPAELSTVLAHEAAHIRHGDLAWLAASRALLVLQWAQPLHWLLRRSMRLDQESLADAAAAEHAGRHQYAEQLVAWARHVSARPRWMLPAAVGLWESPSQLRRRLALLLNEQLTTLRRCSRVWLTATTVIIAASAVLLSLATFEPQAAAETSGGDSSAADAAAGIRTMPSGAKVQMLAIGGKSDSERPDRWWHPDGTPLVSVPFRVGGGSVSPSDDQSVRQFVMLVPGLPPNATVRWHMIDMVGAGYRGEVSLNGQESPPDYYSEVFCISQRQETFGVGVDVAAGDWTTVADCKPQGGSAFGLRDGKSVAFTQAFSITVPHWGDSTAAVVSHNFVDEDVRVIAVDKTGQSHAAGRSSVKRTSLEGAMLTQFDFLGLKPAEVNHFEFQTRDFQSVVFDDLPAQADMNRAAVEFQPPTQKAVGAAEETSAESRKAESVGPGESPPSSESKHVAVGPATLEVAPNVVSPTLSDPTVESGLPDRVVAGDHYVLCKVMTDLQRSLLGNASKPRADASACLMVNTKAFSDEEFRADSSVLKELSKLLAKWAKDDNRCLLIQVFVAPASGDVRFSQQKDRAKAFSLQLEQLASNAGYHRVSSSRIVAGDFDWIGFVQQAESLSRTVPANAELGVGNDRVQVFAVETFLSHLLVNADCVINVLPTIEKSNVQGFPDKFQDDMSQFILQHRYGRQEAMLLRVRCTDTAEPHLIEWVENRQARDTFADQMGFKTCHLSMSYVAESDIDSSGKLAEEAESQRGEGAKPDSHSMQTGSGQPESARNAVAIADDELAGQVVDEAGQPLAGATVDAWTWYPGNETTTDDKGHFRLTGLDRREPVEIEFTKAGYCPRLFLAQSTGVSNWQIKLNSRTFFEGRVTDPEGKPVAGARLRASRGPFRNPHVAIDEVWSEASTDAEGKYRIYLEPDTYDVQMRVPGVGLARHEGTVLRDGDHKQLDIQLQPGPKFRAIVRDSVTNEPVEGIRLWNWQRPGIEGASDSDGILEVDNMLPGNFEFNVSAVGEKSKFSEVAGDYARWWSPDAIKEWERLDLTDRGEGFQRNFDDLEFGIHEGMEPVTIVVERCVRISGRVVNRTGEPVAGATVAPAKTGSGNSLTGDTRYSVRTAADGTFEMRLPASGAAKYNLVAHDGDYEEWRTWANGIGELMQTKPGEVVEDVKLQLSQPCIVRGRVQDANGQPVAKHRVLAQAADKRESRYYDPTTETNERGEFELRFVRPGKHYIQAEPFWLTVEDGPTDAWTLVVAQPDRPTEGVILRLPPETSESGFRFRMHADVTPPAGSK